MALADAACLQYIENSFSRQSEKDKLYKMNAYNIYYKTINPSVTASGALAYTTLLSNAVI